MTDEQIIELASENLYCNMSVIEWSGRNEDILKFARAMYSKGRLEGFAECYNYVTHKLNSLN
jgi:hypothetical protein